MREEFVLDSNVQGGGLQQALIDRFLRDTQRGTPEQFATAFVLLARSLGIEARVATGFVADGEPPIGSATAAAGEVLTLSSDDADGVARGRSSPTADGWHSTRFRPRSRRSTAPPPPEPQVQTPAAPQPPIAPPPEPDNETQAPDDARHHRVDQCAVDRDHVGGPRECRHRSPPAAVRGRRSSRHGDQVPAPAPAPPGHACPSDRIRGAWASATDALVDAGLDISRSATDGEIAGAGEPLVADARRSLRRLAALSGAATYGSPQHPDLLAEDATRCLDAVEESMAAERTRWQRIRWRLSLRSLRPATRSPVTV